MRMRLLGISAVALLALAIVGLFASPAHPTAGRWQKDRWIDLGALANCDDDAINSAVTCGGTRGIKTEGWNLLTLELTYTRSAGTGWQFWLETCNEGHTTSDCTDAADWHVVAAEETIVGTGTKLSGDPIYRETLTSDQLTWSIGMHYRRIRLRDFQAAGTPDSGDKITANIRIGYTEGP